MPAQTEFESNYKSDFDSFIKFLLYRIIIVFTIVFTLLNAQIKMEGKDITAKVYKVNELKKITGIIPDEASDDAFVYLIFFKDKETNNAPGANDSTIKFTDSAKSEALHTQKVLLKEIQLSMKASYLIQLPFFNNTSIDLRYWVFVLPLLYLFSSIFLYILSVQLKIIRRKAVLAQTGISTLVQYPNKYLQELLLLLEILMVAVYFYVFFGFIKNNNSTINAVIINGYAIIIYFSLLYSIYTGEKLKRHELNEAYRPGALLSALSKIYSFGIRLVKKINPYQYLRLGIISLASTLFLVMSYSTCDDHEKFDAANAKKGYQLINHRWEQELTQDSVAAFYQYLYLTVLIIGIIILLLNIHNVKNFLLRVQTEYILRY